METPKPGLPPKVKVMLSLLPLLLLMTVFSTGMLMHWRSQYGRLAREKRARALALPVLEAARESLERAERERRAAGGEPDDILALAERAVDSATEALGRFPDSEEAYRIRGRALEVMYNMEEARADYEKALELHPESPARFHLGVLLTRQLLRARLADQRTSLVDPDDWRDTAVELLRRFQAPSPEFRFLVEEKFRFMSSACVAWALGEHEKVASHAHTAATYDPSEWLMPCLAGLAAFELGRPDEALRELDRALQAAPAAADAHAWKGRVLGKLDRRGHAIESLTRALQINRHFLEAYLVRGTLLYEDGRFAEAREDFETCARLRPSLADVHLRHGIAAYESWIRGGRAAAGDLREAEAAFTRYVDARPKDPQGYVRRARARTGLEDFKGAGADLAAAIEAKPDAIEAYELRAEMHEAQGDWAAAERDCTSVLERSADAARAAAALRRRARVRARAGRPDGALADYDRLIARDPNDVGLQLEKGRLQLVAGRADDALATAQGALDAVPRSAGLLALRAEIRLARGETAKAVEDAGEALAIDPQLADALVTRGKARLALGDRAAARADFEKALERRPDLGDAVAPLLEKTAP